ncbi:sensor histidine kinase [Marivirga harenae]|uniref:sensor histidine kinase n=1 Tax=Marivirga harenae TaxID=2010992 RepID=UPI0026E003F4|nr:HAMP domain-containing sensor histidine kinase [Marivirga harenae]WKV11533.1 HAMP domain-containing sensor histidine kinase [Marivirga harenae]
MKIEGLIEFFITEDRKVNKVSLRKTRLLIKASLLTSPFSGSYFLLSLLFNFDMGVKLMAFNVIGFLLLPFLFRTRLSVNTIGNLYVFVGAIAVIVLAITSGGINSAIYPWIISIPVLALLVVNRSSALIWGSVSFLIMVGIGLLEISGFELPNQFNSPDRDLWITLVQPGLLLIIFVIAYIFQSTQTSAINQLANQNNTLMEQKRTIATQKEELATLIDHKNYVIRILAHDVRSPLKNIQGLIKLLDMEEDEERKQEIKKLLFQTSNNAENLVNRVLEMDKSEHGNDKVNVSSFDVFTLLHQLVMNMQELANKKDINIDLIVEAKKTVIEGDQTYIHLIFENLLSNAIKFSEGGKNIEVGVYNDDNQLLISVADEVPGIHPGEKDKLFKQFSKLSARPTAGESSTGLGLSLVKRYVELSNGKVWYERNPSGKGAVFKVEFPLVN